ncbi:hypothetical protein ACJJIQ_17675 [Microbulbifer sp. ANSA003]|uniref:hypothetical protein n=1 Tax=Microbulbifer sp. ANSA003 TaxID=3243360 RepID=UPI004042DE18
MELLALKISVGWEVVKNHFYDIDHESQSLETGRLKYPFYEDILLLRNRHLRMSIDLGWTPDCDPSGSYKLLLLKWNDDVNIEPTPKQTISKNLNGIKLKYELALPVSENWDKPVEQFESRDRFVIRDKINEFFTKE